MYLALFEVRVVPTEPAGQIIPNQPLTRSEQEGEFSFFATVRVAGFCPCNARQFLNAAMETFPESEYASRRARLIRFTGAELDAEADDELRTVIFSQSDPAVLQGNIESEFVDITRFPLKDKRFRAGVLTRWA